MQKGFIWEKYNLIVQQFGTSMVYLCKKEEIMLEIVLSVSLYIGAIALLVKGAITYCETSNE